MDIKLLKKYMNIAIAALIVIYANDDSCIKLAKGNVNKKALLTILYNILIIKLLKKVG